MRLIAGGSVSTSGDYSEPRIELTAILKDRGSGEEFVLVLECRQLTALGRRDLSRRLRWTADEECDGAGYNVLSFTPAGGERLILLKYIRRSQLDLLRVTERGRPHIFTCLTFGVHSNSWFFLMLTPTLFPVSAFQRQVHPIETMAIQAGHYQERRLFWRAYSA